MTFKLMLGGLLAAAAATAAIAQPAPPAGQDWSRAALPAETRAQVVQRTQQIFGRLDRNRDGAITQDELAARGGRGERGLRNRAAQADPAVRAQRADRRFARLDLNRDGAISHAEFDQSLERRQARSGGERGARGGAGMRGAMLRVADSNRDSRVTLPELTAVALQRFDRLDLNRDGIVSPEERTQVRSQRLDRRG
jgi:Ca2+-binding EF-hand superfamily protein